ncbi:MAG: DUF4339 domain-containing protein [Polyangiaceae bacterium]|nr:DUF4339 domain-containing protein [Polyangiaceae bacterium]
MRRFAYAGAVDLSDEAVLADDDDEDNETWHVLVGPGDVKVVSLDRLNDLYRRDIVDDRTYVWKPGMQAWQQLFLVIGPTQEPPKEEEQPWSVVVAPGEIKQLSLEQLDDWYRLDLIDAGTLVWRPEMPSWQPLGVVAGIETEPAPSPTVADGALVPSSAPLASFAPSSAPLAAFVQSSPPVALTLPAPAQRSGSAERWLLGAALAAGLVVTLYRNDLVTEMARSVHQEAALEHLGQRLGGPGFGTVRGVEALLESSRLQLPEVRVPELLLIRELGREQVPAAAASNVQAVSSPEPTSSAPAAPATPAPKTAPRSGAGSLGSAASPRSTHARGSRTGARRPVADDMISATRKASRGRGTEYDPLNPKL